MRSVFVAMSKDEIRRLDGGRIRGADLLIEVEMEPFVRCWVFGRLRNQYRTQRSSGHPEGWEPIMAEGFPKELRYDLASGTLKLPVPSVCAGGVVGFFWRQCPAKVYRYHERDEAAVLYRREARLWKARFQLLREIKNHGNDAREVGMLMAETLGVAWRHQTEEPLALRIIRYAYALDEKACRDLTGLLNVVPKVLPIAA